MSRTVHICFGKVALSFFSDVITKSCFITLEKVFVLKQADAHSLHLFVSFLTLYFHQPTILSVHADSCKEKVSTRKHNDEESNRMYSVFVGQFLLFCVVFK